MDYGLTKLEENWRQLSRRLIEVSAYKRCLEDQRDQREALSGVYSDLSDVGNTIRQA